MIRIRFVGGINSETFSGGTVQTRRVSRTRRTHVRGRDWPTSARTGSLMGATRRPDLRGRFRRVLMDHGLRGNFVMGVFEHIHAQQCGSTSLLPRAWTTSFWASEPRAEHITHEVQNILIFGTWEESGRVSQPGTRRPNSCA